MVVETPKPKRRFPKRHKSIMINPGSKKISEENDPKPDESDSAKKGEDLSIKKNKWYGKFCDKMVSDEGKRYFKCRVCAKQLKSTFTWTSTPTMNHLRRKHGITSQSQGATNLVHATTPGQSGTCDIRSSFTRIRLDLAGHANAVANMVVTDLCPAAVANRRGFREYGQYLRLGIPAPSRQMVRNVILKKYDFAKKILKEELGKIEGGVHVTTDGWSDTQQRGYFSFTMRRLDENFNMISYPGGVKMVTGRHTAKHLAEFMRTITQEHGVSVSTESTDSASNEVAAARINEAEGTVKERLACATHTLNLVVRKMLPAKKKKKNGKEDHDEEICAAVGGMEIVEDEDDVSDGEIDDRAEEHESDEEQEGSDNESDPGEISEVEAIAEFHIIQDIVKRVRRLSAKFRRSNVLGECLKRAQAELRSKGRFESKHDLRLLVDSPTRWSSTHLMIKRALVLKDPLAYVKATSDLTKSQKTLFLDDTEWDSMREVSALLGPFYTATKILSGTNYVTASRVVVLWRRLERTLQATSSSFIGVAKGAELLISQLRAYWDKLMASTTWSLASALDPNYKRLKFLPKEDRERVWDILKEEMKALEKSLEPTDLESDSKRNKTSCDAPNEKEPSETLAGLSESEDEGAGDYSELDLYKAKVVKDKVDPLGWWKSHKVTHPLLAKLAQTYLAVNGSSTESERIFSLTGFLTSGRRNRLSGRMLEAILFLNSCSRTPWLWQRIQGVVGEGDEASGVTKRNRETRSKANEHAKRSKK